MIHCVDNEVYRPVDETGRQLDITCISYGHRFSKKFCHDRGKRRIELRQKQMDDIRILCQPGSPIHKGRHDNTFADAK